MTVIRISVYITYLEAVVRQYSSILRYSRKRRVLRDICPRIFSLIRLLHSIRQTRESGPSAELRYIILIKSRKVGDEYPGTGLITLFLENEAVFAYDRLKLCNINVYPDYSN